VSAKLYRLDDIRERVQRDVRRIRRPFEIKLEKQRLEARARRNIFELMTEEEAARLMEVAPSLMQMRSKS
jgi:hypothetical protein